MRPYLRKKRTAFSPKARIRTERLSQGKDTPADARTVDLEIRLMQDTEEVTAAGKFHDSDQAGNTGLVPA